MSVCVFTDIKTKQLSRCFCLSLSIYIYIYVFELFIYIWSQLRVCKLCPYESKWQPDSGKSYALWGGGNVSHTAFVLLLFNNLVCCSSTNCLYLLHLLYTYGTPAALTIDFYISGHWAVTQHNIIARRFVASRWVSCDWCLARMDLFLSSWRREC